MSLILKIRNFKNLTEQEREDIYELYYFNRLEEEEREEFENILDQYPEILQDIQTYVKKTNDVCNIMEIAVEEKEKKRIQSEKQKQQAEKRRSRNRKLARWGSIAACLAIVLYLSFSYFHVSPEELISQYPAEPLYPFPCKAVRTSGVNIEGNSIIIAYSNCDYQKCIEFYEAQKAHTGEQCFYAAHAYLGAGLLLKSKETFKKVTILGNVSSADLIQAAYYTTILELQIGDSTKEVLNDINSNAKFQENLNRHLLAFYMRNKQFKLADSLASKMGLDWRHEVGIKLHKWRQDF